LEGPLVRLCVWRLWSARLADSVRTYYADFPVQAE